jgi:hypothetical protein
VDDLNKLSVLFLATDGTTYTDNTAVAYDYLRDSFSCYLVPAAAPLAASYLLLGRDKPFNSLYVEIDADYPNSVTTALIAQYWNGSAWTSLPLKSEDTKAFQRSGYIKWTTPETNGALLWGKSTISSTEKYWLRLSVATGVTSTTKLKGVNLVLADDQDLKGEDYSIRALLPKDENGTSAPSHIASHVAAREAILDRINRGGRYKVKASDSSPAALDQWDLLEVGQIRLAATYKALSKIYLEASDNPQDIYWSKYQRYESLWEKAMDLFILTLDTDDNGQASASEKATRFGGGTFYRR